MVETGIVIRGETTSAVLSKLWSSIDKNGRGYQSQRGPVRSLKGVSLVIGNPLEGSANYPYWSKEEDGWYQSAFVRKETSPPPEIIIPNTDIYPYTYAERSRYYDGGTGYIKGVVDLLKNLGYQSLKSGMGRVELTAILKNTYTLYHPERILAVLHWQGLDLINFYLSHPKILELQLQKSRRDTLHSVVNELFQNPNSRRAITPSFTYENIDHSGIAGGVPVYQQYQLCVNFSPRGRPESLTSFHLHRAMDAKGGTQLDISHDREWGTLAGSLLGLPLKSMVIYCNDIYHYLAEGGSHQDLAQKTDIRSWLFAVVDGYDPKTEDIEKRLGSPLYQKKIELALAALSH